MTPTASLFGILLYGLTLPFSASAASALFLQDFSLHDRDEEIVDMMGYSDGAIVYWKEMASINQEKYNTSKAYESIGCYPFYLMRNGLQEEFGLNCRSFYCSGYRKGTVQCQDREGKAVGGEVEIQRRKAKRARNEKMIGPALFESFPVSGQTPVMKDGIEKLSVVRCKPFYLMEYGDVAVGDGYRCEEIGQYPYYSGAFECTDDWRIAGGMRCSQNIRLDEFDLRMKAMSHRGSLSFNVGSGFTARKTASTGAVAVAASGSAVLGETEEEEEPLVLSFADLTEDHPAFAAIQTLVANNVLTGYGDGTFKPGRTVNRAEFLKMLFASVRKNELRGEHSCFPDVSWQWFSSAICAAKRLNWVKGYESGLFYPEQTVNRAEAIKMLMRALGDEREEGPLPEGVSSDAWFAAAARSALARGILTNAPFYGDGELTRAEAALWMAQALEE